MIFENPSVIHVINGSLFNTMVMVNTKIFYK